MIYILAYTRFLLGHIPFVGLISKHFRQKFQPYPFHLWLIVKKLNSITWYEVFTMLKKYSNSPISENDPLDLFDTDWYVKKYNIKSDLNPLKHYLYLGWELGNDPSLVFSTQTYFELNDLDIGQCPLLQFHMKQIFGKRALKTFSGHFSGNSKKEKKANNIVNLNQKNIKQEKNKNVVIILDSIFGDVERTLINIMDQDIDLDHIYIVSQNSYNFNNVFKNKVSLFGLALNELLTSVGNSNTNFLIIYSGQKLPNSYFGRGMEILSNSNTNILAPKNLYIDEKVSIGNIISDTGISMTKEIEKVIADNISETNYLPNLGGVIFANFDEKLLSRLEIEWFPKGNGEFIYFANHIKKEKVIMLHEQYVVNEFKLEELKINEYDFLGFGTAKDYLMQQLSIKEIVYDKYRDYIRQPILIVVKDDTFNMTCNINKRFISKILELGFKLIELSAVNQDILNRLDEKNDGLLIFNRIDFDFKDITPNFSGKNILFFRSELLCIDECSHGRELTFKEISIDNLNYYHNRHYYAKFFEIISEEYANSNQLTFSSVFLKTWTQLGLIPPNMNFIKSKCKAKL